MVERLKGKVALVVGAGSTGPGWGNGKATAVAFAREGARVFCADINPEAAEETAGIIRSEGAEAVAHRVDVTKAADVIAMVEACVSAYGRIDVLDNNVGIAEVGGVVEISEADWDRVFAVNLKSAYLTMKQVIPLMVGQGGGSIINISSIASIRYTGVPYATYYASKAALNQLTRTTAVEYANRRVRVNAILPGLMKTPMVEKSASLAESYAGGNVEEMWRARDRQVPMGFGGDAWDIAWAAVYLASDESRYVTGIELVRLTHPSAVACTSLIVMPLKFVRRRADTRFPYRPPASHRCLRPWEHPARRLLSRHAATPL
jgi:NAD(P)-dependent dehydrogenase (short-subunit alcohol dehydrogenase family)